MTEICIGQPTLLVCVSSTVENPSTLFRIIMASHDVYDYWHPNRSNSFHEAMTIILRDFLEEKKSNSYKSVDSPKSKSYPRTVKIQFSSQSVVGILKASWNTTAHVVINKSKFTIYI